ncbi:MAG: leucine-rich repeat protein [Firmicutes bacterium]|nr:leucine-rich repeat protein [Bacillota bacterium]
MKKKICILLSVVLALVFAGVLSACNSGNVTVTFDTMGGSPSIPSQTVRQGTTVLRPDIIPEKAGVGFFDWYADKELTQRFDFERSSIVRNMTLYAKYLDPVRVQYSPTYIIDYEEEQPDIESIFVTFGKPYAIPMQQAPDAPADWGVKPPDWDAENPDVPWTHPGPWDPIGNRVFGGWFSALGGGGIQYAGACGTGFNWPEQPTTLYAFWTLPSQDVFIDLDVFTFTPVTGGYEVSAAEDTHQLEQLIIPSRYNNAPVTRIAANGFKTQEPEEGEPPIPPFTFTEVLIPNTVTVIGAGAFEDSVLENIIVPGTVRAIGNNAFANSQKLAQVILLNGIETVGNGAFRSNSALTQIILPDSIVSLGSEVFARCSALRRVILPRDIEEIPRAAFQFCISLQSIRFPGAVETIGQSAFDQCTALTRVDFPISVKFIGTNAFANCGALANITLPSFLEEIGNRAFHKTAVSTVTIPSFVEGMGSAVFFECANLTTINVRRAGPGERWQPNWNGSNARVVWNYS